MNDFEERPESKQSAIKPFDDNSTATSSIEFEKFLSNVDQFKISLEYKYQVENDKDNDTNKNNDSSCSENSDSDTSSRELKQSREKLRTQQCNLDSLLGGSTNPKVADESDTLTNANKPEQAVANRIEEINFDLDIDVDVVLETEMDASDILVPKSREEAILFSPARFLNATENDASDFESDIEKKYEREANGVDKNDKKEAMLDLNEEKEVF